MTDELYVGTSWETDESTGLLDDYDFTIQNAQFTFDARYANGGVIVLLLSGVAEKDGEIIPETDIILSLGDGWSSRDGETAVNEKGATRFKNTSNLGRWIDRFVKDFGMASLLVSRGEAYEAKTYRGLRVHVKRETINFGEGIGEKQVNLPNAFLGVVEGGAANGAAPAAAAPAAAPAPAPAPAATAAPAAAEGLSDTEMAVVQAKLRAVAKEAQTHTAFVDLVMDKHPEFVNNNDIMALVVDPGGIYAETVI